MEMEKTNKEQKEEKEKIWKRCTKDVMVRKLQYLAFFAKAQ
jgi:hypothetical protein